MHVNTCVSQQTKLMEQDPLAKLMSYSTGRRLGYGAFFPQSAVEPVVAKHLASAQISGVHSRTVCMKFSMKFQHTQRISHLAVHIQGGLVNQQPLALTKHQPATQRACNLQQHQVLGVRYSTQQRSRETGQQAKKWLTW
jgi:hypothetical protein